MTGAGVAGDGGRICLMAALGLLLARGAAELALESLNRRHVRTHGGRVPEALQEVMDAGTYAQSIRYTCAKSRFGQVETAWDTAVLLLVLLSGVLPWGYAEFGGAWGTSTWARGLFLVLVGMALALTGLPTQYYAQFRIEERFGFNTTSLKVWCLDRLKGALLGLALGYPMVVLVLSLVGWTGAYWWCWAWVAVIGFQLLMALLAPVLILPLFNKFTPLPEGALRDRLLALAARTRFRAQSIQVMDGSKRSRHSNAFFTGFGRFRKIVLYDTLVQQLTEPELEAVLAHEIGHYRKRHIHKLLAWSAATLLVALYAAAWLAGKAWFYAAFDFPAGDVAPALLLFALLSGSVTFWFSPLTNLWSRRFEYQADAYAAGAMAGPVPLIAALRKLNAKNLSNLTPHPFYSGFYYSHPTLLERERALLENAGDIRPRPG